MERYRYIHSVMGGWAGKMGEVSQVGRGFEEFWHKSLDLSGQPLISSNTLLPTGESGLVVLWFFKFFSREARNPNFSVKYPNFKSSQIAGHGGSCL